MHVYKTLEAKRMQSVSAKTLIILVSHMALFFVVVAVPQDCPEVTMLSESAYFSLAVEGLICSFLIGCCHSHLVQAQGPLIPRGQGVEECDCICR